jgi:cold shock protein
VPENRKSQTCPQSLGKVNFETTYSDFKEIKAMKNITIAFTALFIFAVVVSMTVTTSTVSAKAVSAVLVTRAKPKIDLPAGANSIGINGVGVANLAQRQGVVKLYNEQKKFGLIKIDNSNDEISFNESGLIDQVKTGDRVEFDIARGKKGLNAINIRLL